MKRQPPKLHLVTEAGELVPAKKPPARRAKRDWRAAASRWCYQLDRTTEAGSVMVSAIRAALAMLDLCDLEEMPEALDAVEVLKLALANWQDTQRNLARER